MTAILLTDHDREFYEERLEGFLPDELTDIHAHCWLDGFRVPRPPGSPRRAAAWPALVARDNSFESLEETYRLLFPGKRCRALVFGFPDREYDVDVSNDYVASSGRPQNFYPLLLAQPHWSANEFSARLDRDRFLGAKVYLNFAPDHIPGNEIRIFDFAPHHQLEVLDQRGGILILHIPRPARLRDPVNLHEMIELERRYPRIQTVIAHVGRAYCGSDLGDAFERLSNSPSLLFDISANTNEEVFASAIDAVGPQRLLFGSDLPITRMRMRRFCENGRYINVVPPGLYGDVSADPSMRESSPEEAHRLTFFLYEEIDAFRRAAVSRGLGADDIKAVFHTNAMRILETAAAHYAHQEIHEEPS